MRDLLLAAIFTALATGCSTQETPRTRCIAGALRQPGLHNGVAAFTDSDRRTRLAHANWIGGLRLARDQRYAAASLTKPLVALEIKRLVDTRNIGLDTPIHTLLEDHTLHASNSNAGNRSGITVRHLLQHTAGLGHPAGLDPLWHHGTQAHPVADCHAAGRYALTHHSGVVPGEKTEYSNAGYCLLGEIVLNQAASTPGTDLTPDLQRALASAYGGAGGWYGPLPALHRALLRTLPLEALPSPAQPLADGSWYNYGWRWWPSPDAGTHWTHTGRLPGLLAVALTDGQDRLLLAHFDGNPSDYHAAAARFGRQAWACMTGPPGE